MTRLTPFRREAARTDDALLARAAAAPNPRATDGMSLSAIATCAQITHEDEEGVRTRRAKLVSANPYLQHHHSETDERDSDEEARLAIVDPFQTNIPLVSSSTPSHAIPSAHWRQQFLATYALQREKVVDAHPEAGPDPVHLPHIKQKAGWYAFCLGKRHLNDLCALRGGDPSLLEEGEDDSPAAKKRALSTDNNIADDVPAPLDREGPLASECRETVEASKVKHPSIAPPVARVDLPLESQNFFADIIEVDEPMEPTDPTTVESKLLEPVATVLPHTDISTVADGQEGVTDPSKLSPDSTLHKAKRKRKSKVEVAMTGSEPTFAVLRQLNQVCFDPGSAGA